MSHHGLRIVTAPRLEPLFDRLAEVIEAEPLGPEQHETILVARNGGLRVWVEHALARRVGCAASLDLRAPGTFAADLATRLVPGAKPRTEEGEGPQRHPFDLDPLAWRLAGLLRDLDADEPCLAPLRAYLAQNDHGVMPLAARLAMLFDNYQIYRPDVLAAWERSEDPCPAFFGHGAWQAYLWKALQRDLAAESGDEAPVLDRARRLVELERRLLDRGSAPGALPKRISVFGARVFPPLYYRVLAAAARWTPVTVYAVAAGLPDDVYDPRLEDEGFRHPLGRALGEHSREWVRVLHDLGRPPVEGLPARRAAPQTALHELQEALIHDRPPTQPTPLAPDDRSLRVLDAHSPVRELEVLRDELLRAFEELPGLRPHDVLVLVPDLETYAPLVDAVFGAEKIGEDLQLPYHIVDHPHAPAQRVLEACLKALFLHEARVTASDLLDLLDYPAVRRRARVREEELTLLRAWIREAHVCWGLSAEQKAAFGLPEDDLHTWRFGLDRLLLGVVAGPTAPTEDGLLLGHLPCEAAGLGGADLLGRFAEWADRLFRSLDALDRPRPLDVWPDHLIPFVDGLLAPDATEEVEAVAFLREVCGDLERLDTLATAQGGAVSFRAVRTHLKSAATRFDRKEPYLTGRITVAEPFPLRHAPHRVVAFLGLNDGVYPHSEEEPGFDLLAVDPRPGDPAPRRTEKQLFLDALHAARDRMLLSYVGRSQKDNSERAASVVLDAFLDAAEQHWGEDARRLVVQHRLQPFAQDYFQPESPLYSYATQHRVQQSRAASAGPFIQPDRLPETADAPTELTLDALAQAWTNPSRHFAQERLGLTLEGDEQAVRDDEPIALDGLELWQVHDAVLTGLLDGLSQSQLQRRLLRSGLLPAGATGRAWLRRACEHMAPVAEVVGRWGTMHPLTIGVRFDHLEGRQVVGQLQRVGPHGALHYRAGAIRPRHLVQAWAEHLALNAWNADPEVRRMTTCVGVDGKGQLDACHFEALPADEARLLLQQLVRGHATMRQQPPALFEKASYAYAEKMGASAWKAWRERILAKERYKAGEGDGRYDGNLPAEKSWAFKKAQDAFGTGYNLGRTDLHDPHIALVTRGRDPFSDEARRDVHAWALCLWSPILLHRQTGLPPS